MILGSRHDGTGHWPNNRPSVRRENLKSGQQPSPHLWRQRHDDTHLDSSGGSSGGRLRKMVAKPLARRAANGDSIAAWGESRLPQSEVEGSASHSACLKGGVKRAQPCHGESPVRPSIRSDAASVRRSYRDDVPPRASAYPPGPCAHHAAKAGGTGSDGLAGGGRDRRSRNRALA
jgi:hypothetical protein